MRGPRLFLLLLTALASTPAAVAVPSPDSTVDAVRGAHGDRSITFVGVVRNRTDLADLGAGTAGYWFPQFDAPEEVRGATTQDNVRDALPAWITAFNHTTGPADPGCTDEGAIENGCLPTYLFRTFSRDSQDLGSYGGIGGWSFVRLPSGECGASGAIVDPQTYAGGRQNNNNTINRIQLTDGTPARFFVSVLTDNTAHDHDPAIVSLRGNVGLIDMREEVTSSQVEPNVEWRLSAEDFNGRPDLYVFEVSGFTSGDFLKLRLRGLTSPASFGGLLFDTDPPGPGQSFGHARTRGPGGTPPPACPTSR